MEEDRCESQRLWRSREVAMPGDEVSGILLFEHTSYSSLRLKLQLN